MDNSTKRYLSIPNEFKYLRTLDSNTVLPSFNQFPQNFLNYFQIGQTSYYVLPVSRYKSKRAKMRPMERNQEGILQLEADGIHQQIHPDDLNFYLQCEQKTFAFFDNLKASEIPFYKMRFDFRAANNGLFKRYLQQRVVLEYAKGAIRSFLIIMTDISQLKRSSSSQFSIVCLEEKEELNIHVETSIKEQVPLPFSRREKEIFPYLVQNLSSKEIATKLFVTEDTIRGHRKRMLKKTNSKNTLSLIITSFKNGWI